ncbi:MAG: AP protein [Phycisphaerae bacterium]|nr:AP protein [Phycisphaerae bacterium]
MNRTLRAVIACTLAVLVVGLVTCSEAPSAHSDDRRVVLVMIDGLRWQEVFRGATDEHFSKESGLIDDATVIRARFGQDTPSARRAALMPFFWSTVAREGALWGNRDLASHGEADNGVYVSYPGYSNTICGFADPTIDSNKKIVNPNTSVFEWLNSLDEFKGRVCAFGCWDVFPFIFAVPRSGVPVDDSIGPFNPVGRELTPTMALVNRLRAEVPKRWPGGHFDAMIFPLALEWMRVADPRVMFIGFGETDEWAHEGRYADYLDAAHRCDGFLAELWTTLQSLPAYRGKTTLIITTDHGRGDGRREPRDWNNHGPKWPGSDEMWCAVIGPNTKPGGELSGVNFVQGSMAATLAAAVGRDWPTVEPRAKPALQGAITPSTSEAAR